MWMRYKRMWQNINIWQDKDESGLKVQMKTPMSMRVYHFRKKFYAMWQYSTHFLHYYSPCCIDWSNNCSSNWEHPAQQLLEKHQQTCLSCLCKWFASWRGNKHPGVFVALCNISGKCFVSLIFLKFTSCGYPECGRGVNSGKVKEERRRWKIWDKEGHMAKLTCIISSNLHFRHTVASTRACFHVSVHSDSSSSKASTKETEL